MIPGRVALSPASARRRSRSERLQPLRVEGLVDALARVGEMRLRVAVELVRGRERPTQRTAEARERGSRYRARVFWNAGLGRHHDLQQPGEIQALQVAADGGRIAGALGSLDPHPRLGPDACREGLHDIWG